MLGLCFKQENLDCPNRYVIWCYSFYKRILYCTKELQIPFLARSPGGLRFLVQRAAESIVLRTSWASKGVVSQSFVNWIIF